MRERSSRSKLKTSNSNNSNNNSENRRSQLSVNRKGGNGSVRLRWIRIGILVSVLVACSAYIHSYSMIKGVSWAGSSLRLTNGLFRGPLLARRGAQPFIRPLLRPLASLAVQQTQSPLLRPTTSTMASEAIGNFDLVKRVDVSYSPIRVSKWRSRVTGLSVVHIDYEGNAINTMTLTVSNRS